MLRFSQNKTDQEIATELGISEEAYRKRMGEIYRKFDINGKGPGKHNRLTNSLNDEFKQQNTTETVETNVGITDIDNLVKQARQKSRASIQERCGTMRVLDMSQPVSLDEIYTNIEVLEKITSRRRLEITDLVANYNRQESDRLSLAEIYEGRISGLDALKRYPKLILLGKPGAGKTTLLKYTALQCSRGKLWSTLVPIFITLRQFAAMEGPPKLLEYIIQEFSSYGFSDRQSIKQILSQGKALILLDGLDEVKEEDNSRVIEEIRSFSEQFYLNHFAISSRLASQQYIFEKFTEVEVADFEPMQVLTFTAKWFATNPSNADKLVRRLEENQPLKELATSPLLLTLLCLVFAESGDFPSNRAELYKEGLDVLLKKWDAKRNIERHQIYKKLSIQRKEDLLAQVALTTFSKADYFFRQEELEQYIINYICNLPKVNTDPESLQLDSEAILKSIEAQHGIFVERAKGIYSFSHLTFQEYLATREIINSSDLQALEHLACKVTDKRWHDIFIISVGMLRCADDLLRLMKQQIDGLLDQDDDLQKFLQWVAKKSRSVYVPHQPQAVRAFYLSLGRSHAQTSNINLAFTLARTLALDLDLARNLTLQLNLALDLARAFDLKVNLDLDLELDLELSLEYAKESEAKRLIAELELVVKTCPDDVDRDEVWQKWTEDLRQVMITYRDIGHSWQFSDRQKELLRQYCDANRLLIDCLNSDCYVTQAVRQEIEQTLILPMSELKTKSSVN